MAQTFEEWMAANGLSNGYGPGYVYSKSGGSFNRSDAIRNWQQEQNAGALSGLMSNENSAVNPFGAAPGISTDNRFSDGLSDAEARLQSLLDNPDSINQSAAYKFRVGQGQEALQRSLGAKGMLNSGNRLMELTKYGQDMGSQEYDAQYGRLGSLLGNYATGYTADKNANTAQFGAQATAWNQAQGNADKNRLGFANLAWDMSKPQSSGRSLSNLQPQNFGSIGGDTPVDWNAFSLQQTAKRNALDRY